jgi:hypothetical protein
VKVCCKETPSAGVAAKIAKVEAPKILLFIMPPVSLMVFATKSPFLLELLND